MEARRRSVNFSAKEEAVLVELVRNRRGDLQCKKWDTQTNRNKRNAWLAIEKEFNKVCGDVFRTAPILKNKYENLKKRAKCRFAKSGQAIGGGTEIQVPPTDVDVAVKDMISTPITGLHCEPDRDPLEAEYLNHEIKVEEDDAPVPTTSVSNDWNTYTPAMVRTPQPVALQISRSEKIIREQNPSVRQNKLHSIKMMKWAASQVELVELQKKALLQLHKKKLAHLEIEHQKRMELMQRESDVKVARIRSLTIRDFYQLDD